MVGHGGSSAGSYLADPTSPIPSHCASIVVTSTLRVKSLKMLLRENTNVNLRQSCMMTGVRFVGDNDKVAWTLVTTFSYHLCLAWHTNWIWTWMSTLQHPKMSEIMNRIVGVEITMHCYLIRTIFLPMWGLSYGDGTAWYWDIVWSLEFCVV